MAVWSKLIIALNSRCICSRSRRASLRLAPTLTLSGFKPSWNMKSPSELPNSICSRAGY
ncbi:MAG: hypothetical protein ACM32G_06220 [Betaproteobacteria bacterium]